MLPKFAFTKLLLSRVDIDLAEFDNETDTD